LGLSLIAQALNGAIASSQLCMKRESFPIRVAVPDILFRARAL
jgi:hypothetical protein